MHLKIVKTFFMCLMINFADRFSGQLMAMCCATSLFDPSLDFQGEYLDFFELHRCGSRIFHTVNATISLGKYCIVVDSPKIRDFSNIITKFALLLCYLCLFYEIL